MKGFMKSSNSGFDLESRLSKIRRYDASGYQCAALRNTPGGWSFEWGSPGAPAQYFIASATKLYVSALIMQLLQEGLLELDTPAASYLPPQVMAGIHVLHGVDASARITVRQLLSHTSGIADYFEQRQRDGSSQFKKALTEDFAWSYDDVLRITRQHCLVPPPAR
jgi:CubicO group peptidase (beta-lactamase class C family)